MKSHLLHLLLYSSLVSAFFALLTRNTVRGRLRVGGIIWVAMVGGALVLAYLMFPFPK